MLARQNQLATDALARHPVLDRPRGHAPLERGQAPPQHRRTLRRRSRERPSAWWT